MADQNEELQVIDVRPLGVALTQSATGAVRKGNMLQLVRLVVPAGTDVPTHSAPGEITVQCLEGRVNFVSLGTSRELAQGDLILLPAGEPHSLHAIENASLLVTRALIAPA